MITKKLMKYIFCILTFFAIYMNVKAEDFTIEKYDVDMVVNENNSFDIAETITAYFNTSRHGIYRTIPLKNTVERLDGTTSSNRVQITNIEVNNNYTTHIENDNLRIKIGDPNRLVEGMVTYKIKYNYNIGRDPLKDKDELYFNIIGLDWDTTINNVTFRIVMPKEFDSSKLGFSSGPKLNSDSSNVIYNIDGNTISGRLRNSLGKNEALSIRLELDEGYFKGSGMKVNTSEIITVIASIIMIFLSYSLWNKSGRDDVPIESVSFYPPDNLNPAEIGFYYNGYSSSDGILSLLIYLAKKGYIKIIEEEPCDENNYNCFSIEKIKDYDGTNEIEKMFLEGLFKGEIIEIEGVGLYHFVNEGNSKVFKIRKTTYIESMGKDGYVITIIKEYDHNLNKIGNVKKAIKNNEYKVVGKPDTVTEKELMYSFTNTIYEIEKKLDEKKENIYDKESDSVKKKHLILSIIFIISLFIYLIINLGAGNTFSFIRALIGYIIPGTMIGVVLLVILLGAFKVNSKIITGIIVTYLIALYTIVIYFIQKNIVYGEPYIFIVYTVGFISVIISITLNIYMKKRTPYGVDILGKIKGLKNFLETAEKEKIEALASEKPDYFYDILPYAYALDVSDEWIKKFETINIPEPTWYESSNGFSRESFNTFLSSTMMDINSSLNSDTSSSGGSSGGGSSGGGSGGGGGGSW